MSFFLFLIPFSAFPSEYKGNVLLEYPMIQENGEKKRVVVEIPKDTSKKIHRGIRNWWSPPYLGMGKWKS